MINKHSALNSVINVGSDKKITVLALAEKIVHLTGSSSVIKHKPALPAGDMKRRCPDITFLNTILDKEPITLEEGLGMLIRAYGKDKETSLKTLEQEERRTLNKPHITKPTTKQPLNRNALKSRKRLLKIAR
ncbi:MAG: hypothetical protein AB8F78_03650 [Saprospiraceae bacterium]